MNKTAIALFLKKLRNSKKLTQEQLASELHVDRSLISKWENGKAIPSIEYINTLCEFYNVSIDELLYGEAITKNNKNVIQAYIAKVVFKSQQYKKIIFYLLAMFIILIMGFLSYYFVNSYEKIQFYQVKTESNYINITNGILFKTRTNIIFNFGVENQYNKGEINEIAIIYKINNNEKIIYKTNSLNIYIHDTIQLSTYFEFADFEKMLDNLYIKVIYNDYISYTKLSFSIDYLNDDILQANG